MTDRFGRRLVAISVSIAMILAGCSSTSIHYAHPDLRSRSNQIASIATVTVDVSVHRAGLLSTELSAEWSEVARTNLKNSLAKHFGSDLRFAVKEFDAKGAQEARDELTKVRSVMDSLLLYRNEIPAVGTDCLPGPVPALADAAGTDTVLLSYARDHITPGGTRAAFIGMVVLIVPIFLVAALVPHPPPRAAASTPDVGRPVPSLAEQDAITLCLVDARKGDVLWFDIQFVSTTKDLLDASDVDRLIGAASAKFKEATRQ